MSRNWTVEIGVVVGLAFLGALSIVFLSGILHRKPVVLSGSVTVQDTDPRKQLPIEGVKITISGVIGKSKATSDSSGYFSVTLPKGSWRGEPITFEFQHPEYAPLELKEFAGNKLYLAHMVRSQQTTRTTPNHPAVTIGNVLVQYSAKATRITNIGSAVKTFEVINVGNVACKKHKLCSPDGRWKAAQGSVTLTAAPDSEFRNVRASCIAGPCPFTQLHVPAAGQEGTNVQVSAINWSDTATFLVEAEVVRPIISNMGRTSYPVIFGRALNFTLPASAEGVSLQADLNGQTIIFPLGPDLLLQWAECNVRTNEGDTKVYRCELKPGYRFQ